MTCKYLIQKPSPMPLEIGASMAHEYIMGWACGLERNPGVIGWVNSCEEIPHEGPCWYWVEENGTEIDDVQFKRGK